MTNGQIERYNATMDAKIAALSNEKRTNWDEQLPFVTFNYNASIHKTTQQTPFEMIYGRPPILPFRSTATGDDAYTRSRTCTEIKSISNRCWQNVQGTIFCNNNESTKNDTIDIELTQHTGSTI